KDHHVLRDGLVTQTLKGEKRYYRGKFGPGIILRSFHATSTMLLPGLLRESLCWSKTAVRSFPFKDCICSKGLNSPVISRGLYSFAKHDVCRRAPQRMGNQIRGIKGRRNPHKESQEEEWRKRNKTVLTYIAAAGVGMIGMSYAAVPLYRLYCQASKNPRTFITARLSLDSRILLTGNAYNHVKRLLLVVIFSKLFMTKTMWTLKY
ncbi:hypothetical protein GJAV_G00267170, partial [Gymnothorax javanicus]